jgi:hypothetical protein
VFQQVFTISLNRSAGCRHGYLYRRPVFPQDPFVATGPAHQHIERVHENDLSDDQRDLVVHLAPVPAPVSINAGVHCELNVVDGPDEEIIMQLVSRSNHLPAQEEPEHEQRTGRLYERPLAPRIGIGRRKKNKTGERHDER